MTDIDTMIAVMQAHKGGKQIIFSEECKALIAEIVEQTELSRPLLMPMICPPEDWYYVG